MKKRIGIFITFLFLIVFISYLNREPSSTFHQFESAFMARPIERVTTPKEKQSDSFSQKVKTKQTHRTLEKYKMMKDLPSHLLPSKEIDLLQNKYLPQKKIAQSLKGNLSIEVLPSHTYLTQKDTLTIQVNTFYKGVPANASVILKNNQDLSLGDIELNSIGKGMYDTQIKNLKAGKYYFSIVARSKNEEAFISYSFQVSPHYFDFISSIDSGLDAEGNLFFTERINFLERGTYNIEGVIYFENHPYAQTSTIIKDSEGIQDIELSFHGFLFHRNQVSGSFVLKSLQITKVGTDLSSSGDTLINLIHQSPHFSKDEFNSRAYENDVIINKINTLESR